jgi:hypothetical protein
MRKTAKRYVPRPFLAVFEGDFWGSLAYVPRTYSCNINYLQIRGTAKKLLLVLPINVPRSLTYCYSLLRNVRKIIVQKVRKLSMQFTQIPSFVLLFVYTLVIMFV